MGSRRLEVLIVLVCVALAFYFSLGMPTNAPVPTASPRVDQVTAQVFQTQQALELYEKGKLLRQQGKLQEAYDTLTESLRLDPRPDCPWNSRAWVCCLMKRYDEALSDSAKAIKLATDPGHLCAIWHTRATALQGLGRIAEARQAVEQCLSYDSHDPEALALKAELARN